MRFLIAALAVALLSGCGYLRVDPLHPLIRSDVITSVEQEREILSRASVGWTDDGRIRVLYVSGTPYERGYQQGVLLRREVQKNLRFLYEQGKKKFHTEELFAEAYERLRPFVPQEYIDEMHGLAHGSRLPLHVVHAIHALPTITEWGGKKRIKQVIKDMIAGDLGTTCSNIGAQGAATKDGEMYAVRVLDWGLHRISKLHEYPLITISRPEKGYVSANIGWVGFLGAVSGMNEQGITLGEMGYGDPDNETMRGTPMPFVLRDVLTKSKNLADVRKTIQSHTGDNSFVFLMTDGKSGQAEMYLRDRDRFLVVKPGTHVVDGKFDLPAVKGVAYGGHEYELMGKVLTEYRGSITPELLMTEIVPKIALKSNFHNVVYRPGKLQFWVNNAKSKKERAAEQPYTFIYFADILKRK